MCSRTGDMPGGGEGKITPTCRQTSQKTVAGTRVNVRMGYSVIDGLVLYSVAFCITAFCISLCGLKTCEISV